MKLATKILWALVIGAVVGVILNVAAPSIFTDVDEYVFKPLGTIFLNLIKMLMKKSTSGTS